MSAHAIGLVDVGALRVRISGVSGEVATAALEGLESELLRRIGVRGIDALAVAALAPSTRIPALHVGPDLDAAALRDAIAQCLVDVLAPLHPPIDASED
jgi:hypothetical protein